MEYQFFQGYGSSLHETARLPSFSSSPVGMDEDMLSLPTPTPASSLDAYPQRHIENMHFSAPTGPPPFVDPSLPPYHGVIPCDFQQVPSMFYPVEGGIGQRLARPLQSVDATHVEHWLSHSDNWMSMPASLSYPQHTLSRDSSLGIYPPSEPPLSNDSALDNALDMYIWNQHLAQPSPAPARRDTNAFARGALDTGTTESTAAAYARSTGETVHFHRPGPQVVTLTTPSPDADRAESTVKAVHSISPTGTDGEPARTREPPLSTDAGPSSSSALSVSLSMPSSRQRSNSKAAMTKALYKVLRRKLFPEVEGPMSRVTQLQAAIDRIIELEEEVARLQALRDTQRAETTSYAPLPRPRNVMADVVPLEPGIGRGGAGSDGRTVKSKTWMPYTPHFQKVERP